MEVVQSLHVLNSERAEDRKMKLQLSGAGCGVRKHSEC